MRRSIRRPPDVRPPRRLFPDSAGPFIQPQLLDAYVYLGSTRAHSVTSYTGGGSIEERGATWLFLRWLASQKGEDIFGRLVQTAKTGSTNVETQAGESFGALFGDFSAALVVDSIPGVPRHERVRRDSGSARATCDAHGARGHDRGTSPNPWPLPVYTLGIGGALSSSMIPGTMVHATITPAAGGSGVIAPLHRPAVGSAGGGARCAGDGLPDAAVSGRPKPEPGSTDAGGRTPDGARSGCLRGAAIARGCARRLFLGPLAGCARTQTTADTRAAVLLTLPSSSRALALGDAWGAVADDESALFYNPAQLARVRGLRVGGSLQNYIASTTLGAFAVAVPLRRGTRRRSGCSCSTTGARRRSCRRTAAAASRDADRRHRHGAGHGVHARIRRRVRRAARAARRREHSNTRGRKSRATRAAR